MARATRNRSASARHDHWQRLTVETPENVALDYELAGFGSRMLAAIGDLAVIAVGFTVLAIAVIWLGGANPWGSLLLSLVWFGLFWGYFTVFEARFRGQTPGKKWMGLRVVRDSGHPIGFPEAALRNLLRVADYLPPPALIGLGMIALHPKAKRLGDLVAGTVVVRDRPLEAPAGPVAAASTGRDEGAPRLAETEFKVLDAFLARAPTLDPAVRARFADRLVERFADHVPGGQAGEAALVVLFGAESARRESRFGGRSGGAAERFVTQKRARWAEFQTLADDAATRGLDALPPDQLLDFTSRYREVAADYARARTYGVAPATIQTLERAVGAGHNALYRERRHTWHQLWTFVALDAPAAVVTARRAVVTAFLVFTIPALLGFGLLRERPALASEVLPDVMLERAEAGIERQRAGQGYFDAPAGSRPLIAASIIANNVQVAFYCFVGGIFLGVGSLVLLAANGLAIGAASGHFANVGLFGYLWTFVAGHGVLELFAIWVAGAAGFQLGLAALAPGRASRREALVLAGRLALRMVGFATVLLLVAGLVEGLISASPLARSGKIAISVASAVLLAGYLALGARAASGSTDG